MGNLHEHQCAYVIAHHSVLVTTRNVKIEDAENTKTHILCLITCFFFFENRAVYEIMWKKTVEPDGPQ